mmetsp:Transcript_27997/g.41342  ORF Transcript_27997/g.41342 Transcript_27997/m.41342 type:complete len:139 (-) Transcript_27997:241-657(-)
MTAKDDESHASTTIYYGPRGTTPGGTWYKEKKVQEVDECGDCPVALVGCLSVLACFLDPTILCVGCCCDGGNCCDDDSRKNNYIYKDPITKKLYNERGHICGTDTHAADIESEEELDKLHTKYSPTSGVTAKEITGRS